MPVGDELGGRLMPMRVDRRSLSKALLVIVAAFTMRACMLFLTTGNTFRAQVEETMDTLSQGPESLYEPSIDLERFWLC